MEKFIELKNINKKFGDFYANKDVNLDIYKGEVHTLLGENGAGKSTLMNVLIGLYEPSSGEIYVNGKKENITDPLKAVSLGIGMVHQHFMLVESMTVFENIILGDKNSKGFLIDEKKRREEILEISKKYGFDIELDKKISEISIGAKQRVEILKTIYHGAWLLILDEPTAALTDIEVEGLYKIINILIEEGKSIIFISHKMREVLKVSNKISILRSGEVVGTYENKDLSEKFLASLMIGKELENSCYEKKDCKDNEDYIVLKNVNYNLLNKHGCLNNLSLTLKKGEILGIAGVDGNGQSELAKLITGLIEPESGEVFIKNNKINIFDPLLFIKNGIAHIPEDRNSQGLAGDMTIADNIVLKSVNDKKFSKLKGTILNKRKINSYGKEMMNKYDIRGRSIYQDVRSLSGGNQQKVILAREIELDPDILVMVHPTRGLDIGATKFIHNTMIKERDRGKGIILISADIDEILEVSDRIIVLFEGEKMGEYFSDNIDINKISLSMTGINNYKGRNEDV